MKFFTSIEIIRERNNIEEKFFIEVTGMFFAADIGEEDEIEVFSAKDENGTEWILDEEENREVIDAL